MDVYIGSVLVGVYVCVALFGCTVQHTHTNDGVTAPKHVGAVLM